MTSAPQSPTQAREDAVARFFLEAVPQCGCPHDSFELREEADGLRCGSCDRPVMVVS